jgi:hypothetical protein
LHCEERWVSSGAAFNKEERERPWEGGVAVDGSEVKHVPMGEGKTKN